MVLDDRLSSTRLTYPKTHNMAPGQSRLFEPLRIGPVKISSRIVMGPVGSVQADSHCILGPSAIEYYASRACVPGTLIIGEATFISAAASGTLELRAGIWNDEQIAAWKAVVDAVHGAGSFIFLQLWALGRSADPEIKRQDGTGDVVSSSAVPQEGGVVPRAMTEDEIWQYVRDYATAAENAVEVAGFDGVELHGGNGSLIDQFTQDVVNKREDQWGGSVENRSRFALEITKAVCAAVGSDRVGFRVSPWSTYNSMGTANAVEQFSHLLQGLKNLRIAYIHLVESRIAGRHDVEAGESLDPFIDAWDNKPILLAGGFTPETAKEAIDKTYKNRDIAIAFGRAFVTNKDLVQRLKDGRELL
jgi:NADPH2 dehydrogenase